MFIRQLAYLVALDRHRHFGRAAEGCNVSPPALSAGISELERELGIKIVKRNRSFQGITPEGERVLLWARQVLSSLDGLRQEASLVQSVAGGHLIFGAIPTAVQAVMLLTAECRRLIPGVTLEVYTLSTKEILQSLKKQDLHFGMTYIETANSVSHDIQPLLRERYFLVSDAATELPATLTWAEIATLPLCLLSRDMENRHILDQTFEAAGLTPHIAMETNSISLLYSEARSGRVHSVMPKSALPAYLIDSAIKIRPIAPELVTEVGLLRMRQEQYQALSTVVWELARTLNLQDKLNAIP